MTSKGVRGNIIFMDFNFDLIPLENDLLSLEMADSLKDTYLNHGLCLYQQVAESLQRLQVIHGQCKDIMGKGPAAEKVIDILQRSP